MKPPAFWISAANWANKNKLISFVVILGTLWVGSYDFRTPKIPAMKERLPEEVTKAAQENQNN